MFNRHLLVVAGLALVAGSAMAQGTYREDERNARQEQRIQEGLASGGITRREADMLQQQQREIHRAERRAAADGVVTREERMHIRYLQDRADQSINRLANNRHVN